jgi:hypothetical protein
MSPGMTVTDVEIGHARQRRSPDGRAAIEYLLASGAVAISLIEVDGAYVFRTGPLAKSREIPCRIFWISAQQAKPIVRRARKNAGPAPNLTSAATALHEAASDLGATLTPHATAIERAGNAATKLNAYFESMRRSGQLAQFNKQYKQRRTEATANGRGFMSWSTAMTRLKRALVPLLMNGGKQPTVGATVFEEVFPTVT